MRRPKTGGRKRGATNKTTRLASRKAREMVAKVGELPHEFLLRVMRGQDKFKSVVVLSNGEVHEVTRYPTLPERLDAARAAAPYYAPRLVASIVEGHVNDEHHHVAESVSDTARWVAEMLGLPEPGPPEDSKPH